MADKGRHGRNVDPRGKLCFDVVRHTGCPVRHGRAISQVFGLLTDAAALPIEVRNVLDAGLRDGGWDGGCRIAGRVLQDHRRPEARYRPAADNQLRGRECVARLAQRIECREDNRSIRRQRLNGRRRDGRDRLAIDLDERHGRHGPDGEIVLRVNAVQQQPNAVALLDPILLDDRPRQVILDGFARRRNEARQHRVVGCRERLLPGAQPRFYIRELTEVTERHHRLRDFT